jgi:hypothetical protein
MEERRAFSGGERIEVGDEWSAVRSGEGCPERERRISWSMVGLVYNMSIFISKTGRQGILYGVLRSGSKLIEEVVSQQNEGAEKLKAAHWIIALLSGCVLRRLPFCE